MVDSIEETILWLGARYNNQEVAGRHAIYKDD